MKNKYQGYIISKQFLPPENFDHYYSINQNLLSISLYIKGAIYNNPSLLFGISLFNLFQELDSYSKDNKVIYNSYSQALTTYFLRQCENQGLIKIIEYTKCSPVFFDLYYTQLSNEKSKVLHNTYSVNFIKIRSFNIDDINFIKSFFNLLNIDQNDYLITLKNKKIYIEISNKIIFQNFKKGVAIDNLKKIKLHYEKSLTQNLIRIKSI